MKYEILQQAAEYCTKSKEWQKAFDLAFHAQIETINEQQAEIDSLKAERDSKQVAFESTADSFARVFNALSLASPKSIVHHLNGEGACLQMINDLRYQADALKAQRDELLAALNATLIELTYTANQLEQLTDLKKGSGIIKAIELAKAALAKARGETV